MISDLQKYHLSLMVSSNRCVGRLRIAWIDSSSNPIEVFWINLDGLGPIWNFWTHLYRSPFIYIVSSMNQLKKQVVFQIHLCMFLWIYTSIKERKVTRHYKNDVSLWPRTVHFPYILSILQTKLSIFYVSYDKHVKLSAQNCIVHFI